jgi:hypothetical protein
MPFWLPASTYYFLASAIAIGVFFLTWAILLDAQEESPWIAAGLIASGILICSGAFRELILKGFRKRALIEQQKLDLAILSVPLPRVPTNPDKLTLERNAAFLNEIQRKSEAAKVLSSIPASHREVFELCEEYLGIVDKELPKVGIGSPRLRPLTKGREYAARFHRYHMLRWAEGEARNFAQVATTEFDPARKLERATEVLSTLELASLHYPDESKLKDSESAIKEMIVSSKAKLLLDKVRGARSEGDRADLKMLLGEAELLVAHGEELSGGANILFIELRSEIESLKSGFTGQ